MDFDLNQVSVNAPNLFNLSNQNSSDEDRKNNSITTRFDQTIVGSVFHDNAEKLHSDLIGIDEERTQDEGNDKHILYNPNEMFQSYAKHQQQTQQQHIIPTYKDLTTTSNTAAHTNNIGLPAAMYATTTTKENSFFETNNEDDTVLSHISKSNQFNEKQVRILNNETINQFISSFNVAQNKFLFFYFYLFECYFLKFSKFSVIYRTNYLKKT